MAARVLTERFCESVKPTPGKQVSYPDTKVRGVEFRVAAEGRKVWTIRYRLAKDGRQRRLTLGVYPAMDLAGARSAAILALGRVSEGRDPAGEKREAALAAKAAPIKTFGDLINAYFAACECGEWKPKGRPKRASTIEDERRNYRVHIEPSWGRKALDDINKAAVKALLRSLIAKGLGARTNRTQALIRQALAFAVAEERIEANPALGIPPLAEETTKTRTLSDGELTTLWRAVENPADLKGPASDASGGRVYVARRTGIIVQLAMLLLQRRSEIAGMRISELDLDLATWLIPAGRMKAARPHTVPLPPRALELIKEARRLADAAIARKPLGDRRCPNDAPVFPGQRDPENSILGSSVTHSFRDIAGAIGLKDASLHDLRRTGSTALTSERIGCTHFVRSQVLGHGDAGGGAAVSSDHYDRNTYLAEKRRALEAWERLLLLIVGERETASNVTELRPAVA